jgi:predicted enzyme involved in methoxymalonyl-ACP biosynthesis
MKSFKELKSLVKNTNLSALPSVKVALVGDTATQLLSMAFKGIGVERGYNIKLFEAEYNQVERQFMDPTSDLYLFEADFIVLFQATHKLCELHSSMSADVQSFLADKRIEFIVSICENSQLKDKKIIYFNYPEIDDTIFGSYANKIESSFTFQVRKLNYELMKLAEKYPNLYICDIANLQNKFGRNFMFSSNIYVSTEIVLSIDAIPYVASRVMDIIFAIKGQLKKCLILDLDNTLWGRLSEKSVISAG